MQLFLYTASMKMMDFLVPIIRKNRLIRCHFDFFHLFSIGKYWRIMSLYSSLF
jgi:hypothetical protein